MLVNTVLALMSLVVGGVDAPQAGRYPGVNLLMEAADLTKAETAKRYLVLDVRPRMQYLEGHIPGAIWIDHDDWSKTFTADTSAATWSGKIAARGITPKSRIVVYDDASFKDAARIWWVLRYCSVADVRLLNGGWSAWQAANGPTEKGDGPPPTVAKFELRLQAERLATKQSVSDSLKAKQTQIIDARSLKEHCGEATTAKRNGAIPDAHHLEWSDLVDAKTRKFKTADELAKLFKDANIDPTKPAVTYCQSGGRAAVMAFGLELMGGKDVRNYYKSWAEWGNAADTPIVKPAPKTK